MLPVRRGPLQDSVRRATRPLSEGRADNVGIIVHYPREVPKGYGEFGELENRRIGELGTATILERTAKSRTAREKTARGKDEGEGMKDAGLRAG